MQPSLPHPTQVRSACERCRKQKLRCTRPAALSAKCTRCQNLGLDCQLGPQRKVGRPSKRDSAGKTKSIIDEAEKGSPGLQHNVATPPSPSVAIDPQILDQQANQTAPTPIDMESMDWMLPEVSDFLLESVEEVVVPSLSPGEAASIFQPQTAGAPPMDIQTAVIHLTKKDHFASLSRINMELHGLWETMRTQPASGTLEGFLCDCNLVEGNALKPYQSLMKVLQDYLVTIKALHKILGTKQDFVKPRPPVWMPRACLILSSHNPMGEASPSCSSSSSTGDSSTSGSPQQTQRFPEADRVILDSPTALLLISCFSQIVQHLEIFYSISQSRLLDPTAPLVPPADNASFAGVPIVEFLPQGALFSEVLRNNLAQIILILGLPTEPWWSGKTVWTGLLSEQRFRDLLNHELGSVENGWTTRPSSVIMVMDKTKKLLTDAMMSGCMDV
ncbi:unnamed protein product [Clonostachys solani]|uniref:Zn(2)-C6 fungal-type domain-containing protein n=1 Tax=Clonostachys solani TaxID=160281 RepID=A0A9N9ZGN4_9HYPO|nr:unnamed protein product [Clonostachys solani]